MPYKDPQKKKDSDNQYHKANLDKYNALSVAWKHNHQEHRHRTNKLYRQSHPEKEREKQKRYRLKHPDKNREQNRKYRARQRNASEHYTIADERYTLNLFNHRCFNCGATDKLHIDHIYPLSKGFALTRQNACVLCKTCNCQKNNKLPEDFYSLARLMDLFLLVGIAQSPLAFCP